MPPITPPPRQGNQVQVNQGGHRALSGKGVVHGAIQGRGRGSGGMGMGRGKGVGIAGAKRHR